MLLLVAVLYLVVLPLLRRAERRAAEQLARARVLAAAVDELVELQTEILLDELREIL